MMKSPPGPVETEPALLDDADPGAVQEAGAWVDQLQRTLKVSRLYDLANPTVVRFQQELASSLAAFVARRGALALHVTSTTLSYGGHDVLRESASEDNLAAVLHRDGVRTLTIEPGVEAREVDSLVEQILRVTGPAAGDDDLVTLVWDANLAHIVIETVPFDGEADGGGDDEADAGAGSAWPKQSSSASPPGDAGETRQSGAAPPGGAAAAASRSDDWTTGEDRSDLARSFDELESGALAGVARFQQEHETRSADSIPTAAVRILEDCFRSDLTPEDQEELAEFIPRVLREALGLGDWAACSAALRLLRNASPHWSVEEFSRGLGTGSAVTTRRVVSCLDGQNQDELESFLALAREFGPPLAEWLMHVVAESQQMRVRRPLVKTIGELLQGHPEQMIPWLSDPRWYVVRNAVHILGWIGAEESVNYLRVPAEHSEMRVRREVVAALAQLSPDAARPILTTMGASAEPPLFVTIVRQLAPDGHAAARDWLIGQFQSESFARRSEEERRALFQALAVRGDEVVPALDAELNRGGLLSRRAEPDRTAITLCLSRIGTPDALAVLERGARSGRAAVRKACSVAEAWRGTGHE